MIKKAFIRYANNKAVPGSLIVRTKAPKVGTWREVPYDLCCDNNNTMNYKIYRAILFQDGTASAPTAYVLENTLGTTPTWVYGSVGYYTADFGLGPLDATKIHSLCTLDPNSQAYQAWVGIEVDPPIISNNILLMSYAPDGNNILTNAELGGYVSIEIKVYS